MKSLSLVEVLKSRGVVHVREDQGDESVEFRALFPRILSYVPSSSPVPCLKSPPTFENVLYMIKGDNVHVHVLRLPVAGSNLNSGDVFILDAADGVYKWEGRHSNCWERVRGC